jgi:hypothetical protein
LDPRPETNPNAMGSSRIKGRIVEIVHVTLSKSPAHRHEDTC